MVYAATHIENNMGSEVKVTSCSKDKEKKNAFQMQFFNDNWNQILKLISQK